MVALIRGLEESGHIVTHNLNAPVDVILMVETRARSPNVTFGAGTILRYLGRYPNTVVVQRINECDERKGGKKFITGRLLRANYAADLTVFVGSWLMDLPAWREHDRSRCAVILNGADPDVFNPTDAAIWDGVGPLRLVTHHWGYHEFKGFDVYRKIDCLLGNVAFRSRYQMSYIGNLPKGLVFKNINMIPALNGRELAAQLKDHHVYITGSINEPGGNHQNEGALCGLPLIYRKSGCMPEYCTGFGLEYMGPHDVEIALSEMRNTYGSRRLKMTQYPHTAQKMVGEWIDLLCAAVENRDSLVQSRHLWRNPTTFLLNQLPW